MKSTRVISTLDLVEMRNKGIISEKLGDLLNRRMDLEVSLARESNYSENYKPYCIAVGCGDQIPTLEGATKWEHYRVYGNFCQPCHTRINKQEDQPGLEVIINQIGRLLKQ